MATKADLEAEVKRLRAELEAQKAPAPEPEADVSNTGLEEETEDFDWERDLSDVMTALEELPQKQPIMLALGALAVGYLLGRAR
ncbi:MAG: hypothetical protein ACU0A6_01490 [Shimia sp.]|jgi:hypothetical protein|uniref:hypothetical protein n=1 Tax=Shimia sp. TaxID=1954381 RepID=UPI00405842B0